MTSRMAVSEVEAAYMIGAYKFSDARRRLRAIAPLPGTTDTYSVEELQRLMGKYQRAAQDPSEAEAAIITAAQAEASARAKARGRQGR